MKLFRGLILIGCTLCLIIVMACLAPSSEVWSESVAEYGSQGAHETIEGRACYTYGDRETPEQAKRAAISLAQEQAVRSHRVFVQSATKVKNLQLEEDVVQTASAALLERVRVEKVENQGREICATITASMIPVAVDDMIRQRVNAKEISQAAVSVVPQAPSPGVKVWTNKSNDQYVENDHLIIYVQSDRDAYLKLDYFQADGTVVHMVPNQFRGQGIIKAGRIYAFGDDTSPEEFTIQEPFGAETIKAIFSVRPFDTALDSASVTGDSREYLQVLAGSRGLKVEGKSHSVTLNTVSKTVKQYQKQRKTSSAQ